MKFVKDSRPTIYDVASHSGISISTVSRVLNSPDQVSEVTRARVLATIDELGFVPRAEARARALQNTRRIGVLTPFFTAPSFVQRFRGVDAALANANHELVIYTVDSLGGLQGYLASLPLTRHLDGLVIMSLPYGAEAARRLAEHKLETVSIEFAVEQFCSVEIDDVAGGRMAAQYLISKGHRRLAFIGDICPPDYAIRPVIARLEGYRQALAEAGISLPENYVRSSRYGQEQTRQVTLELLDQPNPPTAVFAAADIQAIIVMKVVREIGLKVPEDLAVLGFDDLDIADYVGLTTIRQPLDDSGRIAAELLLSRMAEPDRPVLHVNLPLSIVERETV